jgi:hypothetical protein
MSDSNFFLKHFSRSSPVQFFVKLCEIFRTVKKQKKARQPPPHKPQFQQKIWVSKQLSKQDDTVEPFFRFPFLTGHLPKIIVFQQKTSKITGKIGN